MPAITTIIMIRILLGLLALACGLDRSLAAESAPRPLHAAGIENLFQATDHIFSGSQPEGDEAFAALQKLGIKTLISVDGTKPEVERAAKFGLRYIHLPHGYDGISTNTVTKLVKAAQTAEGPLYVHCHHGKHRGPAAVGVICQATAGWTTNQAVTWLKQAGTSGDYTGLFRVNVAFRMPTAAELAQVPTSFPSRAEVSGLVEGMVEIDHRWENLKAIQKAGWRVPTNQPDLVPATEALLLQEAYHELGRGTEAKTKGDDFLTRLHQAEAEAAELHTLLKDQTRPPDDAFRKRAEELAERAGQSCSACHKQHRN
jgi:protein tyrosine phosphatase (PTP) superfamily phosphohydrolase (DUF442 family)